MHIHMPDEIHSEIMAYNLHCPLILPLPFPSQDYHQVGILLKSGSSIQRQEIIYINQNIRKS